MKIKILFIIIFFFICHSDEISLSKFNFLPADSIVNQDQEIDSIPADLSVYRDPFVLKKIKKNVSLISVLSDSEKKIAVIEYDNESILVSVGDLVASKWKVISIDDKEIVLESLRTKKRKTVLLNDD